MNPCIHGERAGAEHVAAVRQRRLDAGLVEVRVWVHPDDVEALRRYAKTLATRSAKESKQ